MWSEAGKTPGAWAQAWAEASQRVEKMLAETLDQAVAWLACRVHSSVDLGAHTLFLGEVVDAGFQKPEDTPVLRMEDTRLNYGG